MDPSLYDHIAISSVRNKYSYLFESRKSQPKEVNNYAYFNLFDTDKYWKGFAYFNCQMFGDGLDDDFVMIERLVFSPKPESSQKKPDSQKADTPER